MDVSIVSSFLLHLCLFGVFNLPLWFLLPSSVLGLTKSVEAHYTQCKTCYDVYIMMQLMMQLMM